MERKAVCEAYDFKYGAQERPHGVRSTANVFRLVSCADISRRGLGSARGRVRACLLAGECGDTCQSQRRRGSGERESRQEGRSGRLHRACGPWLRVNLSIGNGKPMVCPE